MGDLDLIKMLWHAGPIVKFIILVLIAASAVSWAIILKKRAEFKKMKRQDEEFLKAYRKSQALKDIMDKAKKSIGSPLANMYASGYEELIKLYETVGGNSGKEMKQHFLGFGFGVLERGLKKAVNDNFKTADSLLSTLASIGSLSPFVGLLGTVLGIVHSFQGLAAGGGSLEMVAPGIAEALIVTAIGLFAAIPAVWFYNQFTSESQILGADMESFGQDFLNLVERSVILEN